MDMNYFSLGDYWQLLQKENLLPPGAVCGADLNRRVELVSCDSQQVVPGTLFIVKGAHFKPEYLAEALTEGLGDIVLGGIDADDSRFSGEDFLLSDVYATEKLYLISHSTAPVTHDAYADMTIAVVTNSAGDVYLTEKDQAGLILRYDTADQALSAMLRGRCDAAALDEAAAASVAESYGEALLVDEILDAACPLVAVVRGDAQTLLDELEALPPEVEEVI